MTKIKPFKTLMDFVEYPDNDQMIHGPGINEVFVYVSNTYLNGFINYTKITSAYLINRYTYNKEEFINGTCERLKEYLKSDYTHFGTGINFALYDEIMILGENTDYYLLFDYDPDVSDCCFGKIGKQYFDSIEDVKKSFEVYCLDFSTKQVDSDNAAIMEIPVEKFTGWIKL